MTCNVQIMIYFNKGLSSSLTIFKSILHVTQNVWHGQGLPIHVTAYFWVISWTLNNALKAESTKITFKTFEKIKSRPAEKMHV